MSNRYKGAVISATPPTTTGGESGTASGAWTLEQQMQLTAASLWPIQPLPKYIEDVFSTYLYTGQGTGVSQTITNNIDLSTYGGLVWLKNRTNAYYHNLFDTSRGVNNRIFSNDTSAQLNTAQSLTAFNTTGFTVGTVDNGFTGSGENIVSWTFRKQPKFFDIVTFTSSASGNKTFTHNLGSTPGCVFIKNTQTADPWLVYHRSVGNDAYLLLNSTAAKDPFVGAFSATSTTFTIASGLMYNSQTYVAYVFAHNAGGFGLAGTDNVISCGDFTTDASGNATVNLGYEPQFILMKLNVNGAVNWVTYDIMRGWGLGNVAQLYPNITQAEDAYTGGGPYFFPTATGFVLNGTFGLGNNQTNAYIAIRRGPMRVPTVGTSVYNGIARTGTGAAATVTGVGFSPDLVIAHHRDNVGNNTAATDRLRGPGSTTSMLALNQAGAQQSGVQIVKTLTMDGFTVGTDGNINGSGYTYINWNFRRAPSFFDEVCYTGTGSATTFTHNLTVVPELMIVRCRSNTIDGSMVYLAALPASSKMILNRDYAELAGETTTWNSTRPTASVFSVGTDSNVNNNTFTYVNYLFATCAGVSKVGSYTGNGTTQTIDCGFTGGARFVLIKRTDAIGDWYTYDTARGMTTVTDPYLWFNSQANEVATLGSVTTVATGFALNSAILAAINVSAGTYIFLAIA